MGTKLGKIITGEESPSTAEFLFVIDNPIVKKGQYVEVNSSGQKFFGYVSEITKSNRYFERPESVAEYERNGSMNEKFPSDSWEYSVAAVKLLGSFKDGAFIRAFIPPSPGSDVHDAEPEMLKRFLGFEDDGLLLGDIEHHDVKARVSMTRLFQKHVAILAMSGAGKSYLMSVILEELLDRPKEKGRVAVIVVDIHGEYIGFRHDARYGGATKIVDGSEITVPLKKISPSSLQEWLPNLSPVQREVLSDALIGLRIGRRESGDRYYSMKDLAEAIEASDKTDDAKSKKALKRALGSIKALKFITAKEENPKMIADVKPGHLLILDFSTIDDLRKKQILVSLFARKLFKLRKKGKVPPFVLVVEEAHNFAREKAEASEAISKSVIETIAREGRKFGASLCLISQRPVNLSTTALSQCNTHIILRVTNPNDLEHIQMSAEGIDSRIAKSITSLKVGEAILVGEAVNYPTFVKIRKRKSEKRERGKPLHEQAIEFENSQKKKDEGVEAFL
ncbi:ATP-binding protein [Candidatus Micrarchaeota archaeon]|nr:ATP-binding protein [Candidatus Micrarchaeota archaeon]